MGPFTTTKWMVCHGPGVVHLSELPPGCIMRTGQPNCESFNSFEEALNRATALGYVATEQELEELASI